MGNRTRIGEEGLDLPLAGGLAHFLVALPDPQTEICNALRHFRSSKAQRRPGLAPVAPPSDWAAIG
jgi:hypothetical protein